MPRTAGRVREEIVSGVPLFRSLRRSATNERYCLSRHPNPPELWSLPIDAMARSGTRAGFGTSRWGAAERKVWWSARAAQAVR